MKLQRFKVTNFRSIENSGWVEVDQVTSLIGVNESGKTNVMLPLWKLNPARDGEISPTADYPRKDFTAIREMERKPVFIQADFEVPEGLVTRLVEITGARPEDVATARISRRLGGPKPFTVGFPDAVTPTETEAKPIRDALEAAREALAAAKPKGDADESRRMSLVEATSRGLTLLEGVQAVDKAKVTAVRDLLDSVSLTASSKKLSWVKACLAVGSALTVADGVLSREGPSTFGEARKLIIQAMPKFVYYSNYGNLDSEIYLPHVIDDMSRDDLGQKAEARVRTLRVLFEFVNLEPSEILELGQEATPGQGARLAEQDVETERERKKTRDILLQSASTKLTKDFRNWWKQGEYRFRLAADGRHFRIWVSDDLRPEDIELEGRSTGLQWFLSFYLVFLVEAEGSHENTILLLDEPGISLHPLAQRDLSDFFDSLSGSNQILYTTHSPFMVDPDRLDRVKVVYVDEDGSTRVSPDLRITEKKKQQKRSLYPVNAAIGISVSEAYLLGATPVIVEGPSDQHHLVAIKNHLIASGSLRPNRDVVFIPADGVRGVKAIVGIVAGPKEELPLVLLDGDRSGLELAKNLKSQLYAHAKDRVLTIDDFTGRKGDEIEDLWPPSFFASAISRMLRDADEDFEDTLDATQPIVDQVEKFASNEGIRLEKPGWKVDAAKRVRSQLAKRASSIDDGTLERWRALFQRLLPDSDDAP